MKRTLFLILFSLIVFASAVAQSLDGSWKGKLNAGGMELNLVLNFTHGADGKLICTLDSPDQGAKDIPAEVVNDDPKQLKVTVNAIGMSYEAALTEGELRGTFTQGGFSCPLNFKPGTVQLSRPQEPKAPFPYTTEEVAISNSSANVMLSGTLTYPVGYEKITKKDVPVVVMISGSGSQDRDEALLGHKPFLVLADYLARNGVASLRYDDRGVGRSTGDAATITTQTNMTDAEAALTFVKQTGKFGSYGLLGHSEGGLISFMLGAKGAPDFIVTLASPAVRGDSVLIEQNRTLLRFSGMTKTQIDGYCAGLKLIFAHIINGKEIMNAPDLAANVEQAMGQKLSEGFLEAFNTPWMRYYLAYDPSDDISQTRCPVLALNGASDTQVAAKTNLNAIMHLLPANRKTMTKEYVGLNHLFQTSLTGLPMEYGKIEETMSPAVLKDIVEWIKANF